MSSPLERSEKVGSELWEIFLRIVSQETEFWGFDRGCGDSSAFAVEIAATAVLGTAAAASLFYEENLLWRIKKSG